MNHRAASTPSSEANTDRAPAAGAKPRLAYIIATGLGLGYLPWTPGSWGSLLGILLAWLALHAGRWGFDITPGWMVFTKTPAEAQSAFAALNFILLDLILILVVSLAGVWAADRVEKYLHKEDPQLVVVDEVAGQLIAYLALAFPSAVPVNWKYFLLGFILFRVLDVWKPFPARQAESLPGGLGIMADDWMAGVYAAVGLGLIRIFVH